MKVCKVIPNIGICMHCMDLQVAYGETQSCDKCKLDTDEYELLSTGAGLFGSPYAIVLRNGKAEKVSLRRVYGIREVFNCE